MASNEKQSDDEDHLLVAAKNIAIKIFEQGITRNNALDLCSSAFSFADHVIQYFESKEPLSEPLACKAGCHYCCFYQALLTPPEALLIGNYLEKAFTEEEKLDLIVRIDRTLALTDGKSVEERAKTWHDTPCIFLANGRCSVYDVRPFICRAWHSLNSGQCREAFESNSRTAETEGYPHRYHIFQTVRDGLQEVSSDMGCQASILEIAKGMKQYINHPSPTEAWIKGDEVFIS